ncbi:Hypothetical protein NTJ_07662 [Nesidiocoris tenuis]|uniref:Uncharacterized protein n=1 Tax=Nesidiocoris tenuis TaxID=355587 RepID=A0ABN7ASD3_9HEMI|nr:Hypothetical protein NTJ_07662 [Nesidiocoris tenuis]
MKYGGRDPLHVVPSRSPRALSPFHTRVTAPVFLNLVLLMYRRSLLLFVPALVDPHQSGIGDKHSARTFAPPTHTVILNLAGEAEDRCTARGPLPPCRILTLGR